MQAAQLGSTSHTCNKLIDHLFEEATRLTISITPGLYKCMLTITVLYIGMWSEIDFEPVRIAVGLHLSGVIAVAHETPTMGHVMQTGGIRHRDLHRDTVKKLLSKLLSSRQWKKLSDLSMTDDKHLDCLQSIYVHGLRQQSLGTTHSNALVYRNCSSSTELELSSQSVSLSRK